MFVSMGLAQKPERLTKTITQKSPSFLPWNKMEQVRERLGCYILLVLKKPACPFCQSDFPCADCFNLNLARCEFGELGNFSSNC